MNFTQRFIDHNKKIFKKKKHEGNKIFLVEFNGWQVIHIIFSYLINYFRNHKNCKIIAYECYDILNRADPPWYNKYFWKLGILLNVKTFKIFNSFGTDYFLKPNYSIKHENKAIKIMNKFYEKNPNLIKLENFKEGKIWLGDLIYDSFLKKYNLVTINIHSEKFKVFFKNSLKLFLFWEEFFNNNKVIGISVCHSVYITGIPLRIAQSKKINCFAVSSFNCDLINLVNSISYKKKLNGTDVHFKYYKDIFFKFSKNKKNSNLMTGKKILYDYISGKKRLFYLKNKTYSSEKIKYSNKKNSKIKVVIFAHDFVDSPHVYGNHFFPDFKVWFNFLNEIIKKTDYEWYIKLHPGDNNVTNKEILEFTKKNRKLKILKKNFPNNRLVNLGVSFGLTVFGTIASELAPFGIRVINASKNNPHQNFNFSINPKSLKEYEFILKNLHRYKRKFIYNKNDLYIFQFSKNLITQNHLIFKNNQKYFSFREKKPLRFTPKIYDYWLKDFNVKNHNEIIENLKKFIESQSYAAVDPNIDTFND